MNTIRYEYRCSENGCTGQVTKTPVGKDGKGFSGLGGWRCAKHGPVKVKRSMLSQK